MRAKSSSSTFEIVTTHNAETSTRKILRADM